MRAHLGSKHPPRWSDIAGVLCLASACVTLLGACTIDPRDKLVASVPDAGGNGGGGAGRGPCVSDCPEVVCPADDGCRDFASAIPANACSETGACPGLADCPFKWKPDTREGTMCRCDGQNCLLLAGLTCTAPGTCTSGSCLATNTGSSVCCDVTCADTEACSADGKSCEPLQPCEDGEHRCSGTSYQECSARQWTTVADCALGCSTEHGGCLRSAGQACAADADCGEGSCLETSEGARVCCTAACEGACRRCAPTGTECANVEDDAACGTIACPAADPCRAYAAPSVESGRCLEGACKTPEQACSFTPQNPNLECSPMSLCDDAGSCSQPKHGEGEACSAATECESGACVVAEAGGSVCCSGACAPNELCASAGGCVPAPVCENGATQCSGSDFQRCTGGQWVTEAECGMLGCSETLGGCLSGAGDPCESDADCGVGSCLGTADGTTICCTAACAGACRRCAGSGLACDTLADDDACGSITCPDDEVCRDYPDSVDTWRCVDGRCGSASELCEGTPRAAGQPCSPMSLCDAEGNCSAPRLDVGEPCDVGEQCGSTFCVDNVCCNEDCNGVCETCTSTGECQAPLTDDTCDPVLCSELDPGCVTSTVDITENLCREKGVCKDDAECGLSPDHSQCVGTFFTSFCDGLGHCEVVTLPCGAPCDVEGMTAFRACCVNGADWTISCIDTSLCILNDLQQPTGNLAVRCYANADCPLGNRCCLTMDVVGPRIDCVVPPDPPDVPELCLAQLCGAPLRPGGDDCTAPQQCSPILDPAALSAFSVCQ